MDFLELLESFRETDASPSRLFTSEDGRPLSSYRRNDPRYTQGVARATELVAEAMNGSRRAMVTLQEAMTTSDFPIFFGDTLDRGMLAAYRNWPVTWPSVAARRTVRDFRPVKDYKPLLGGDGILTEVGELAEYPEAALTEEAALTLQVAKYGRRVGISWEAIVNDNLDLFRDIPNILARAARRTEDRMVTELYVGASGPNTTLYTAGNANIVNTTNGAAADNPALSITGLQDAFTVLSKMTSNGEPILREMVTLVVPPALEITARNILEAITIDIQTPDAGEPNGGGRDAQVLRTRNWMASRTRLVVNPYIPIVASTANGDTSWFLFADPAGVDRPAIRIAFLRGFEEPQLFIKSANARRVGGGEVDPLQGDFDLDGINYKVRHVVGAGVVDPKATVMSDGKGS